MGQPPYIQKIIPCACGSTEPYWHGDTVREYCCDACWSKRAPIDLDALPGATLCDRVGRAFADPDAMLARRVQLDDQEPTTMRAFIEDNANDDDNSDIGRAIMLEPGEAIRLGGGAGASFILRLA